MPFKYAISEVNENLENLWETSLEFLKKIYIKDLQIKINHNGKYRKIKFKTKPTVRVYAFSKGETYTAYIQRNIPRETFTIVIKCKYSIWGRGFVWLVPQENLDKLTRFLGIPQIKFLSKKTPLMKKTIEFIKRNLEEIQYCEFCGAEIDPELKHCEACGEFFEKSIIEE